MVQVVLDGTQIQVTENTTLLKVATDNNIEIPSLCGQNRDGEKIPCDLCVVEVEGQGKVRACEFDLKATTETSDIINVITHSEALALHRKEALTRIMSDHYADCQAPCQTACPAGVDIQSYLFHIAQGDNKKALEVITKTLPMPLSIGRVCPAFCEAECRRSAVDEPIAIRQLKRHAADVDLEGGNPYVPPKGEEKGKSIAVVGSGPGGLTCGYYLSNEGYNVTVFESMPETGGWLRYGIPEYRLPKSILDKEVEHMCANGMEIKTNVKLGQDIQLTDLSAEYDAVCLAVGASLAVEMNYTGSELGGCYLGVDYLKDYVTEQTMVTGKKVAVIGGGNTAIDCARTAARAGADTTLIYRRTREEMPAEDYEVDEAEHEGVKFHFLTNPVENIADENGNVKTVKLEIMALGAPDDSGRRRPQATGEYIFEEFDTVIAAVSQKPDLSFLDDQDLNIPLTRWNTADAHPLSMHSPCEDGNANNLFSIGDFRRGPATAIEAIADGRRAAVAIDHFFAGKMEDIPQTPFNAQKEKKLKQVDTTQLNHIKEVARVIMPELTTAQRELSFDEVELGFGSDEAMKEAARCLECGCQANTDCKLRDYSTEYKVEEGAAELFNEERQKFVVDDSSEFITFDANRCISCGQCVSACGEDAAHGIFKFKAGEPQCRPNFVDGHQMADSSCVQCGVCVQACPTGALVDKRDKSQGRLEVLKPVETICTYCGVGCKVTMFIDESSNQIRYIEGTDESPVNEGMLCVKGRFGFDFITSESRLKTPLIRKNGELVPATWDEAIEKIAAKFGEIKEQHGGDALAGFSSAKTTNQDNYLFQKFIRRELGTNNVDHCARLCHASTVTGLEASLGSGAMTNDIPSIEHSDLIFIIGSDTTSAHPIIGSHIKRAVKKGAKLVVADPKRILIADDADLYVAQRPGTDVMLINGIMQQIIKNGWQDSEYLANRVEGYDDFQLEVMSERYALDKVAVVTGVSEQDIMQMARMFGLSEKVAVYYSMGITQHTTGHDNVRSIANLQLILGNIGIEGGGINPLRGQSNVQGACDMGALPNNFPGYQKVYNPTVHQKFVDAWNAPHLSKESGLTLTEIIDGMCDKSVRGLYVMGENPVLSDPDQHHVLEAIDKVDFLVVQDIFLTETAQYADVVLPSFSFAEKEGHFTNTERRVQRLHKALDAPGEARNDWEIIQQIAQAMGADWNYQNEQQITDEICQVTPQYGGISWQRVEGAGLQWPCPDDNHPGTRVMHQEKFIRGKAELVPVAFRYAAELPDSDYPMILTTGRLLEQFHTGTMTRKTKGLENIAGPRIMISVADAERLNVTNSQPIKVTTRRGNITAPAFITKRMQAGVVFVPFHFAEAPANRLTIAEVDPTAKIPEFKVAAAKVEVAVEVVVEKATTESASV
ncbi:formate dehydrogenase subunit alpha [Vibrio sp. SS-MA-C1-2]|uniref:formate dehydrogenase subunit alpha n=1 Tax=Vibrio sp. SS-MA-C1-2 TaxID=2908646 RepID=UPI001F44B3A1|nr:formate dehydrogenase subunit alpha [Vibrio sp. SS-MA-C1-2]UJF17396.1 formate dehydrogenase subunit alpha [Vibrio sp. SS-MA-C1-2]